MADSKCVVCLGESGKPLAGKRCTSSRCKAEYAARLKMARQATSAGDIFDGASISSSASTRAAQPAAELESLVSFKLWELFGIYGR